MPLRARGGVKALRRVPLEPSLRPHVTWGHVVPPSTPFGTAPVRLATTDTPPYRTSTASVSSRGPIGIRGGESGLRSRKICRLFPCFPPRSPSLRFTAPTLPLRSTTLPRTNSTGRDRGPALIIAAIPTRALS
ncbi:unnamed protein product [Rhizoctonia solani]|uniref:Uncharacterized protein n=1 Tax=Rhizoctonia solani TaxID=456999 RepID=A0A8H2X5V8_9AGAM|nr:unnamed protein product [Rhizoctonia solani]